MNYINLWNSFLRGRSLGLGGGSFCTWCPQFHVCALLWKTNLNPPWAWSTGLGISFLSSSCCFVRHTSLSQECCLFRDLPETAQGQNTHLAVRDVQVVKPTLIQILVGLKAFPCCLCHTDRISSSSWNKHRLADPNGMKKKNQTLTNEANIH